MSLLLRLTQYSFPLPTNLHYDFIISSIFSASIYSVTEVVILSNVDKSRYDTNYHTIYTPLQGTRFF